MIQFAYTIFYVNDVTATIAFYEKAFGLSKKFIDPTGEYGELDTGATTLSFAAVSLGKKNLSKGFIESQLHEKPFGMEIAFATNDVQQAVDNAVKAGATLVESPKVKPWGQTVAYVRDINGFLIEICTPVT